MAKHSCPSMRIRSAPCHPPLRMEFAASQDQPGLHLRLSALGFSGSCRYLRVGTAVGFRHSRYAGLPIRPPPPDATPALALALATASRAVTLPPRHHMHTLLDSRARMEAPSKQPPRQCCLAGPARTVPPSRSTSYCVTSTLSQLGEPSAALISLQTDSGFGTAEKSHAGFRAGRLCNPLTQSSPDLAAAASVSSQSRPAGAGALRQPIASAAAVHAAPRASHATCTSA